jgi:transcriptional regulator with XRE-family HTH domain
VSPQINPRRARLGTRLRELRAVRYRSASALGRDLGWQQSRVSKLERGAQLPTPEDLDAWATATGAGPAVRAELADLLTSARVEYSVWSDVYRTGGIAGRQAELGRLEAQAAVIREYQPAMIPGLVQTPAYARELLSIPGGPVLTGSTPEAIEGLVAERIKRQELLYQPNRRVQIVLGQAALWTHFGSINTLLGQLDRLVTLAELDSVELGIVPVATPSPIMPLAGFSLHDNEVLYVETLTDEHRVEDPEQIAAHVRAFDLLRDVAATGQDAAALIQRVAAGLR